MNPRATKIVTWFATTGVLVVAAQEQPPVLKESPARLVACIESTARADLAAARVNIVRDAAQKQLRLYSISPQAEGQHFKEAGWDIELVYSREIAAEHRTAASPYPSQYNHMVLTLAGAQYASGNRALGLHLVKLLAQAEPDLFWSTPVHAAMPIASLLSGLEKGDDAVTGFLTDQKDAWAEMVKLYGPPLRKPVPEPKTN